VVFADVTGSTGLGERLDPETTRRVMSRYFREMASILEGHGGTVEKFIGDAVMAVFGVPAVHEDDALRAVRAASEMRTSLATLNEELHRIYGVTLEARTGVNTGEVVSGELASGQTLVTGDAVNVAARLEEAASPGDILLGEATYRLVRDTVSVEPTSVGRLRGKEKLVATYRLLEIREGDLRAARGLTSPLVGRAGELSLLQQAFELSDREGTCYLFTVLGTAGVGKSRLSEEAIAGLGGRPIVLRGRCLPYGEGITFWPVREVVWQACDIPADADTKLAREAIAAHLRDVEHADRITEGVAQLIGLAGASGTPEETFWGIRRFIEVTAGKRPVVIVFDDLHWGEPSFLELIEYLSDFTHGPILLLCLARLELLDVSPAWGAGRQNSMTITLSPLSDDESRLLVENLLRVPDLDDRTGGHIAGGAEGNPFFLEEIVRMYIDQELIRLEGERWVAAHELPRFEVPPTISALLAARLERLDEAERAVAQRASVIGKVFYWGAVAALTPEPKRGDIGRQLQSLVRKELITPDVSSFSGEDAFRFRHILIRDAAYQAIPKETRADLHERLAVWVEARVGDRMPEFEEIIGHHLEQAYRYRSELGRVDAHARGLAVQAAERLASSGRRAFARSDLSAASTLLHRAVDLLPEDHPSRASVLADFGQALLDRGDLARAEEVLDAACTGAEAAGDRRADARGRLSRLWLLLHTKPEGQTAAIQRGVEGIFPILEQAGDERGLAQATDLLVEVDWMACRYKAAERGLERVVRSAGLAGDRGREMSALARLAATVLLGPTHAEEGLRRSKEVRERASGDRRVEASVLMAEAQLQAMLGRFKGSHERIEQARAIFEDLGLGLWSSGADEALGSLERLAGNHAAAEQALRRGYEELERLGERGFLSTMAAELGQAVVAQGRLDEAERLARISEEAGASDDAASQVMLLGIRAKVDARKGDLDRAESQARRAVQLANATDALNMRGDAYMDLAEVVLLGARPKEAADSLEVAIRLYEGKGNVVSAERARESLAAIAATAGPG
jgi:class 3 adenylate cyclase/tetratricopeptide (TPR) repeat protein